MRILNSWLILQKNSMNNKTQDWQEISREEAFKKYSRKIEKVIFKLPNGKETDFYIKSF